LTNSSGTYIIKFNSMVFSGFHFLIWSGLCGRYMFHIGLDSFLFSNHGRNSVTIQDSTSHLLRSASEDVNEKAERCLSALQHFSALRKMVSVVGLPEGKFIRTQLLPPAE